MRYLEATGANDVVALRGQFGRAPSLAERHPVPTDPLGLVEQTLLGRYRIDAPIAQGGMGMVYRGSDLRLLRPVCVKIFHRLSGNDSVDRASYDHFVQEAFALSRLSHPNTLRIYDFGHLSGESKAPFHVCELLDGGTLGQWVRSAGPRSATETLSLIAQVAGALSEAHASGIIHRDVKPSNIILGLIGPQRVAKLGDFGIAMAATELGPAHLRKEDTGQSTIMRLYSAGWAAPEQLRGESAAPSTDVFGLGLVTAFVLAGRTIFSSREEDSDARERYHDAHVARRMIALGLAPELSEVIQTACREDPSQRYQSMEDFVAALGAAVRAQSRQRMDDGSASLAWPDTDSGVISPLLLSADEIERHSPLLLPADEPAMVPLSSHTPTPHTVAGRARGTRRQRDDALLVDCAGERELSVFGRRLTLLALGGGAALDLGGEHGALRSTARFRVTLLPGPAAGARLNLKGLNCFVASAGTRPATAVNLEHDDELELLGSDRRAMERITCSLGRPAGARQLCRLQSRTLAVAGASLGAVLLDVGPGRELILIHHAVLALCLGGFP
jgi:serine/threonine protein kinase